ncbi:hypothetical protein SLOPH_595 [Spraguea lophii 42_110]|uniref:Transmembrane protein n=1 Tax=Spraguea lophii (strain 42_110) TaxID=1358809 RepID=S7XFT0_SPRLO|nr:hypothetical protein SLOPH_595 [Spraguea lophii 42_110]
MEDESIKNIKKILESYNSPRKKKNITINKNKEKIILENKYNNIFNEDSILSTIDKDINEYKNNILNDKCNTEKKIHGCLNEIIALLDVIENKELKNGYKKIMDKIEYVREKMVKRIESEEIVAVGHHGYWGSLAFVTVIGILLGYYWYK